MIVKDRPTVKALREATEELAGKVFGGIHYVQCRRPYPNSQHPVPYEAHLFTFHGDTYETAKWTEVFVFEAASFDGYLGAIASLNDKLVEHDRQLSAYWGRPSRV